MEKRFNGSFLVLFSVALFLGSLLLISLGCARRGRSIRAKLEKTSDDGRFIDHGDGTVTDTKTNLMWTKKDSWNDTGDCMDWNASKRWVSRLTKGGYSNWRMPTVEELKKIYEESKENISGYKGWKVALDPIFSKEGAVVYWSSETSGSCCARGVYFHFGYVSKTHRDFCFAIGVRAVRR